MLYLFNSIYNLKLFLYSKFQTPWQGRWMLISYLFNFIQKKDLWVDIIIIVPLFAKAWVSGPCLYYMIKWEKTVPNNWVSFRAVIADLASDIMKTLVFLKWIQQQTFWGQLQWKRKWVIFYRKHKVNFKDMYLFSTGLTKEMWLVISNMYFKCYLNAW